MKTLAGRMSTADIHFYRAALMAAVAIGSTVNVFAADAVFKDLTDNIKSIYGQIIPIILVLAVLALVICAATYLLSKNERRADEAFQWGKRILIGVAIIAAAPWIIQTVINALGTGLTGTGIDDIAVP